jgi:hypothetical protein
LERKTSAVVKEWKVKMKLGWKLASAEKNKQKGKEAKMSGRQDTVP